MNTQNCFHPMLLAVALIVLGRSPAAAQESWVGELVQYTKPAEEIKFGDLVEGKQVYFPFSGIVPIKVRDDREGKLRFHDGHHESWADKGDFVLARDALAYFDRRVQANPLDARALWMRGQSWNYKGEHDNAIKDFDECIRLDPMDSAAFVSRGLAWAAKKEFGNAFRDYDEVLRLDPKDADTYNGKAWIMATCPDAKYRDGKRAVESAKQALELDKNANNMDTLAAAYAEAGDFEQAIRWQEQALKNSDNDGYRRRLELFRKKMPYRGE